MLRRILLIFGYFAGATLIVAFTAALVAYGNDYTYDFSTHSVIQKGHVIIESLPSGIRITEDNKLLKKKTPYQAVDKVGNHLFGLARDGFWPWQKIVRIVAGRVALVNYVILVPKSPVKTVLDKKEQIIFHAMSKDHRHLAYVTGGADAAVYTLEVGNKKVSKLYVPKGATPTVPAEVLRGIQWSDDASHLLIVSDLGGKPQHRLATAGSNAEPVDLTAVYGFNLTGLQFSGSNWRQMYWVSPDGLRRIDTEATTVSGVLADKVSQFWIQPDRILFIQQTDLGRTLWSLDSRGKRQELIQALVESDTFSVAMSRYSGEDELVVVPAKTGVATLYSGIFGDTPTSKVLAKGVSTARFAPDGHLLVLSSTTSATVYDLERSELEHSLVLYSFGNATSAISSFEWFDNYHLLASRGGEIFWMEFDGSNEVKLGQTYGSFAAYPDADAHSVIVFEPSGAAAQISALGIR